ncbi:hypothetical protein OAO87_01280 [bacterium]|nr:hypothetical protein [bacterium]
MLRSKPDCGGWKRWAASPPGTASSSRAYLSRIGVSASGSEAAKGP